MKIDMFKMIGYVLYAIGIVGGAESYAIGGSTGRMAAIIAMVLIVVGSLFLSIKKGRKK